MRNNLVHNMLSRDFILPRGLYPRASVFHPLQDRDIWSLMYLQEAPYFKFGIRDARCRLERENDVMPGKIRKPYKP